ncbi:hypothetical protein AB1L42_15385 [Thalassoglobus sp. JC818]|uniref:hypothetical protein n=1 Tax=Thalassoglobus sp. JC818 TaxID=3232136 RepID=UPI0034578F35
MQNDQPQHTVRFAILGIIVLLSALTAVYLHLANNPYVGYPIAVALVVIVVVAVMAAKDSNISFVDSSGNLNTEKIKQFARTGKAAFVAWLDRHEASAPNNFTQRLKALGGIYLGALMLTSPFILGFFKVGLWVRIAASLATPIVVLLLDLILGVVGFWSSTSGKTRTFLKGVIGGFRIAGICLLAILVIAGVAMRKPDPPGVGPRGGGRGLLGHTQNQVPPLPQVTPRDEPATATADLWRDVVLPIEGLIQSRSVDTGLVSQSTGEISDEPSTHAVESEDTPTIPILPTERVFQTLKKSPDGASDSHLNAQPNDEQSLLELVKRHAASENAIAVAVLRQRIERTRDADPELVSLARRSLTRIESETFTEAECTQLKNEWLELRQRLSQRYVGRNFPLKQSQLVGGQ